MWDLHDYSPQALPEPFEASEIPLTNPVVEIDSLTLGDTTYYHIFASKSEEFGQIFYTKESSSVRPSREILSCINFNYSSKNLLILIHSLKTSILILFASLGFFL